jgi:hypothetical protein
MELLYQKEILDDSKTLEFYGIKQGSFLVVKQQPVKAPAVSQFPSSYSIPIAFS